MSRSAADASSSASALPTGEHHQQTRTSPQRQPSTSPPSRAHPSDTQPAPRASSPPGHAAPQPSSSSATAAHIDPAAASSSSEPQSGRRKRKQVERSSPSASSQGDMADTEMEGGPSKPSTSEGGAQEGQPPKKKRTRTLTTPHQAAVLHALLAQVRRRLGAPFLRCSATLTRASYPVALPHHTDA